MMTPKLHTINSTNMIRMPHNSNTPNPRPLSIIFILKLFIDSFEEFFGMMRAHVHRLRDFLVDDDVDLYALFGFAFQNPVEAPLVVAWYAWGATKV
jgi:hypothetical protein